MKPPKKSLNVRRRAVHRQAEGMSKGSKREYRAAMKKPDRSSLQRTASMLTAAFALVLSLGMSEAWAVDAGTCGALMGTYSIVPYSSWGTAPFAIQRTWNDSDCNHQICEYMQKTFNVVPYLSWGSLPVRLQNVWNTPQVNCNAQLQNPPLRK